MHNLYSKIFHKKTNTTTETPPTTASPNISSSTKEFLAEQELYRYRKQRGVNLGSWFVLERWIADYPFLIAQPQLPLPARSDLDVARGHSNSTDYDPKHVQLQRHWDSWMSDGDWRWIAQRGINTVRIPVGYYHLCAIHPSVIEGTEFAPFGDIFQGAWNRITNAIETAHRHGIGVLLDLHAAPGGQNPDPHSGTSSPPTFFNKQNNNMSHTIHILHLLVDALRSHPKPLPNVVGIELLNEPQPPSDHVLKTWYAQAIEDLTALDPGLPIYIGECWQTESYAEFVKTLPQQPMPFVVLDHHLYRCFTSQDTSTPVLEHVRALTDPNGETSRLFSRVTQSVPMIVGEWSGALNPGSLQWSDITEPSKDKKAFVNAQLELFERYCAGWFWWTYKKEGEEQERGYSDTGWSLRDAVEAGVFPWWVGMKARKSWLDGEEEVWKGRRDVARDRALDEHTEYWTKFPGKYEHWRFGDGFVQGWDDAYAFFSSSSDLERPVPELGFKIPWAKKRSAEYVVKAKGAGAGKGVWEYEHGFSQGVDKAKSDFEQWYC